MLPGADIQLSVIDLVRSSGYRELINLGHGRLSERGNFRTPWRHNQRAFETIYFSWLRNIRSYDAAPVTRMLSLVPCYRATVIDLAISASIRLAVDTVSAYPPVSADA